MQRPRVMAAVAPPGAGGGALTTSGILHLVFGVVGFLGMGAAAIIARPWLDRRRPHGGPLSLAAGLVIILAFLLGGALSAFPFGVGLIWLAVLAIWGWLGLASITAYRAIPHPLVERR
ncbi:hypothetical protein [Mariniluteicoccus flavus]